MSLPLLKILCILATTLALHVSHTPPSAAPTKTKQTPKSITTRFLASAQQQLLFIKAILWASAISEIIFIVLGQLPGKSLRASSLVRLTPAAVIGMLLIVGGTLLRVQCYRTLQKFFTFEAQEEESVGMLAGMMGVDKDQARRVLRKHKGDVEKAADAMLSGDNGDDESPPLINIEPTESSQDHGYIDPALLSNKLSSSSTVIDLTQDDGDSSRSMKLDQAQNEIKFGPSDRAPNPAWQVVPSNTPVNINQEDQAMNEAIQASLADFGSSEELEMLPMEDCVREGGRPVALRTDASDISYAALIIQALSQIPQVRHNIATLFTPVHESIPRPLLCSQLVELFVNLDLAQLAAIVDKDVLPCLRPPSWDGTHDSLINASQEFLQSFGTDIDSQLNIQCPPDNPTVRLFQFSYASAESRGRTVRVIRHTEDPGSVVEIQTGDSSVPNDLISRLSTNLSNYNEETRTTVHQVIVDPSDLVVFKLRRSEGGQNKSTAEPFTFPKQFYLDRFILKNLSIVQQKEAQEREMRERISELLKEKEFLTRNEQGRDVLTDLRASIHYFEEVARNDEPEREESIDRTAKKLQGLLDKVISTVEDIDAQVEKLQTDVTAVYDIPELQQYLYHLRAVFMHTGLPGRRKQIYSYIQDAHGVWWKTVDYTVTEVLGALSVQIPWTSN
ncbi:hypothetical protein C0991_001029 [Blastosporella zonata]|nr:hypothetical protein C0991_001029 [Blastosporella zonata]